MIGELPGESRIRRLSAVFVFSGLAYMLWSTLMGLGCGVFACWLALRGVVELVAGLMMFWLLLLSLLGVIRMTYWSAFCSLTLSAKEDLFDLTS